MTEAASDRPLPGDGSDAWEKLKDKMLAHLDGIYMFSARKNCDDLVTQLIQYLVSAEHRLAHRDAQMGSEEMVEAGYAAFIAQLKTDGWSNCDHRYIASEKRAIAAAIEAIRKGLRG